MRAARLLTVPVIARALGFVLVAGIIVAAAVHARRHDPDRVTSPAPAAGPADPLAAELARCRTLALAAQDDAGCEQAWAESRRRFFTDGPESTAVAPTQATTPGR